MTNRLFTRTLRKIWTGLCLLLCLCLLTVVPVATVDAAPPLVRVGWFDGVFNSISNGRRSGYGYEYQQKLAAYTGWRYEYVTGTWSELLQKLERGEIDLLADVSRTPEREQSMLFSSLRMGTEDYYLFISEDNQAISSHQPESLNGKKVGVNAGSYQAGLFRKWLAQHHLTADIIELSVNELSYENLLRTGQLDAVVAIASFDQYTHSFPVMKIGSSNIYWGVNRQKPELAAELDRAMREIETTNTNYRHDLYEKYMSFSSADRFLPADELVWLNKHGPIKVGYRADYLPFCALNESTGQLNGFLQDFIELAASSMKNANIVLEPVPFQSTVEAIKALQRHEIDAVFPVGMSSYDAEINNLLLTDYLAKTEIYAIIRAADSHKFSLNNSMVIAENHSNISYASMMADSFPNWSSSPFNSTFECLQGTASGKADCVLVSNYRIHVLSDMMKQYDLTQASTGKNMYFSFAVNRDNIPLYSILNRVIKTVPNSMVVSSLAKNSIRDNRVTIKKFVRDNMFLVSTILLGFFIIIFLLMRSIYLAREATKLNATLEQQKEELSQARERAEAANNAKTSFLFNMSHDIRTPMNAIIGFRRLLEKHQDEPEKRQDYLRKIDDSSNVLLSIINNVLEMARIEKGTLELDETVWNAKQFNDTILEIFETPMHQKNLTFTASFEVEHNYIFCDATKLREILLNVLSNAYKYTNEGGRIDFSVRELPSEREGWALYQSVIADNGIGMSKEFLPHIYEEFAREHNSTISRIEGTGLGMPIVKRLIGFMNGTIEVESELGKGTTFTITIPHRIAAKSDVVEHDGVEVDPRLFTGRRLLLVEDNDLNAEIAMELLKEVGFVVDWAEDGEVCLEKLKAAPSGHYRLILMDIQMPKMNGYEATRAIRALDDISKANIPIIAMTANAFEEDKHEAFRAGMNAHVAKPINVGELLRALASIIN